MSKNPEKGIAAISFTPRNERQQLALDLFQRNDILFLVGAAGSGKSHCAVLLAFQELLKDPTKKKIYITRPAVEAGERLGYLPGKLDDKLAPFVQPIKEIIDKSAHKDSLPSIKKIVENAPIAFLRGRTFENCIAILDESQNCTENQIKLFLTRMGDNCKLIIAGDSLQTDIGHKCFLNESVEMLKGIEGVGIVEFTNDDVVRHPLVSKILKVWEQKTPPNN